MYIVDKMAAMQGFPKWLLDCKENITQTKEWNTFLHELHDAIQQQLTESHVQFFTDLSEAEKELFMERATKAIEGGQKFKDMSATVTNLLDGSLNAEVGRQLLEEFPMDTKSDLVVEAAEDGAMSLLKKWPDMKSKLHVCLNQPLPPNIRQLAWRLYLNDPKARKLYLDLLGKNPRMAISPQDLEISQKCEHLLVSEPTFSDLRGSTGAFYGMKALLSYYHAQLKTQSRLRDMDYMLAVPFVQVASPSISRREPASGRVVALLVEEYLSFVGTRPGYVVDSGSQAHNEEMKGFVSKVAKLVTANYPESAKAISAAYVPEKDKIVATAKGSQAVLAEGLAVLIRPVIRAMFVGYLSMPVVLYVWDQYIISLDIPAFAHEWLSAIMAIMLGLLGEKLKEAKTAAGIEAALPVEGSQLVVPQFQYEIKKFHQRDLQALIMKEQKSAMPVLDPTQAAHPPWRHWFNDMIPPYTQPQDRRRAREEREAERERILQQQREAEQAQREKEEKQRKKGENTMMKKVAKDQSRLEAERNRLEAELMEERRRRMDEELRAKDEIDRLQMEINALKHQRPKSPSGSVYSVGSYISRMLIPPPPSRATMEEEHLPVIAEVETTRSTKRTPSPGIRVNDVMADLLKKVRGGMDKIAHGDGEDRKALDKETGGFIRQNIDDLKKAQAEVFGHRLQPGEFETLSPEQQQDASDKMMQLIQKWREDRRAAELSTRK